MNGAKSSPSTDIRRRQGPELKMHAAHSPAMSAKDLRNFGLLFGAIVAGLFGLFFPYVFDADFPLWPWLVLAVFWTAALLKPLLLDSFYHLWMRVGMFVGMVNTRIILLLVFVALIVPVGLLKRVFSGDAMHRKLDASLPTYRKPGKQPSVRNLEKPY